MAQMRFEGWCDKCKLSVEGEQDSSKAPRCGSCAQLLTRLKTSLPPPPPTPFELTVARVRQAYAAKTPMAGYIENVMAHLATEAALKFQADFIAELAPQRLVDLGKFAKGSPARLSDDKSVCVDSALAAAGEMLPVGCPTGEKFTFEIPYIMSALNWPQVKLCRNAGFLATPMASFLAGIRTTPPGVHTAYLVVWALQKGATESHMVYIVVKKAASGAILVDPQELAIDYGTGYCEVWSSPGTKAITEVKGVQATLDLDSGKLGAYARGTTKLG